MGVTGDLQSLWVVQHKRQHYSSYNIQYTAQYVIVQGASAVVCVGVWPVLPGFDVVEFTNFT